MRYLQFFAKKSAAQTSIVAKFGLRNPQHTSAARPSPPLDATNPSVADLVEALLKAGADPNCRNSVDWSPLLVGHKDMTMIILNAARFVHKL